MAARHDTLAHTALHYASHPVGFGAGDLCWYHRDSSDRVRGKIVHQFAYRGDAMFVIAGQDGQMDVRPDYLVAHKPDETIGFGSQTDDLDAELADIVLTRPS